MRGCACEGDQGFAHVSCLVRHDEILLEEANRKIIEKMEHQLAKNIKMELTLTDGEVHDIADQLYNSPLSCKLCKKKHNAIILHAIGWGFWKQCAGKSERRLPDDFLLIAGALENLSNCLSESGHQITEVEQAIAALDRPTEESH